MELRRPLDVESACDILNDRDVLFTLELTLTSIFSEPWVLESWGTCCGLPLPPDTLCPGP